jgi:Fic-DOC domain mobile mystery protein B
MALKGAHAPGATPLTEEDLEGLKAPSVRTHSELNQVEAANIVRGQEWALRARLARMPLILSDQFIQRLHKRMFGDVWRWAGEYRPTDTNIGVPHLQIRQALRQSFFEAQGWLEHNAYAPDEFVVRLHHRVVSIHPFRNGNGRHARMLAHVVMVRHFKMEPLPWGDSQLRHADRNRDAYLDALRAADHRDIAPLLAFARSRA